MKILSNILSHFWLSFHQIILGSHNIWRVIIGRVIMQMLELLI
jgi:hypothetical protein